MEVRIKVTHIGEIGDEPAMLTLNDVNKDDTVNLYLDGKHYRVNIDQLERAIKAIK
jgi:hypothetical protein